MDALLRRLALVGRALDQAHETYARALTERDELVGLGPRRPGPRLRRYHRRRTRRPRPLKAQLESTLAAKPTPLVRARALMAAYQSYLHAVTRKAL